MIALLKSFAKKTDHKHKTEQKLNDLHLSLEGKIKQSLV